MAEIQLVNITIPPFEGILVGFTFRSESSRQGEIDEVNGRTPRLVLKCSNLKAKKKPRCKNWGENIALTGSHN